MTLGSELWMLLLVVAWLVGAASIAAFFWRLSSGGLKLSEMWRFDPDFPPGQGPQRRSGLGPSVEDLNAAKPPKPAEHAKVRSLRPSDEAHP